VRTKFRPAVTDPLQSPGAAVPGPVTVPLLGAGGPAGVGGDRREGHRDSARLGIWTVHTAPVTLCSRTRRRQVPVPGCVRTTLVPLAIDSLQSARAADARPGTVAVLGAGEPAACRRSA